MERGSDSRGGSSEAIADVPTKTRPGRVLLIDCDEQLAQVLAALLESNGLEVTIHTCPPDACSCLEAVAESDADVVLVNVAEPIGSDDNLQGWQCLQNLARHANSRHLTLIGYTIFDSYTLGELGIDPSKLGLRVLVNFSNPAEFADTVAAGMQGERVA